MHEDPAPLMAAAVDASQLVGAGADEALHVCMHAARLQSSLAVTIPLYAAATSLAVTIYRRMHAAMHA